LAGKAGGPLVGFAAGGSWHWRPPVGSGAGAGVQGGDGTVLLLQGRALAVLLQARLNLSRIASTGCRLERGALGARCCNGLGSGGGRQARLSSALAG
jgi:hypothetical protein